MEGAEVGFFVGEGESGGGGGEELALLVELDAGEAAVGFGQGLLEGAGEQGGREGGGGEGHRGGGEDAVEVGGELGGDAGVVAVRYSAVFLARHRLVGYHQVEVADGLPLP